MEDYVGLSLTEHFPGLVQVLSGRKRRDSNASSSSHDAANTSHLPAAPEFNLKVLETAAFDFAHYYR